VARAVDDVDFFQTRERFMGSIMERSTSAGWEGKTDAMMTMFLPSRVSTDTSCMGRARPSSRPPSCCAEGGDFADRVHVT